MKLQKELKEDIETALLDACEQDMFERLSLDQPCIQHLKSGGSRTRAKIVISIGLSLGLEPSDVVCIASTVELLHNASLIHDDVQDNDEKRRGGEALWKTFGKFRAICSGDAMISAAFGTLSDIQSVEKIPTLLKETQHAVSETIHGQALDLSAEEAISLREYETIAAAKSGPLFRISMSLPMIMADQHDMLLLIKSVSRNFAIAYQINDDLGDWQEDLASGDLNLINLLSKQMTTEQAINSAREHALALVKHSKSGLSGFPDESAVLVNAICQKLYLELESH